MEAHDHIKLPFRLIDCLMRQMKTDQLVVFKGSAPMNDYLYQLTEVGRERARLVLPTLPPTSAPLRLL